jgi:hypothetical protein
MTRATGVDIFRDRQWMCETRGIQVHGILRECFGVQRLKLKECQMAINECKEAGTTRIVVRRAHTIKKEDQLKVWEQNGICQGRPRENNVSKSPEEATISRVTVM